MANTELEKLKFDQLTMIEAVNHCARIIHLVHDDAKDKDFELEMSWICNESLNIHEAVPIDILAEAERLAKLTDDMDQD